MKIKIFHRKFNQGTGSFGPAMGIFALLLIVSLAILVLPANSGDKDWPNKPITIIVPWGAGAGTDLGSRALASALSKILGVSINVVNKPGGSGIIGTLEAVKSPPDGYTLLADIGGTSSIQSAWFQDLPYKLEERTYIARAISAPQTLIVPASSPWKTVEDLVNAIRTDPGSISFALAGGAGAPDVCIAQFRAAMVAKGVDISKTRVVNYKGAGEALLAVAGGHVKVGFASPSGIIALISAGKLRALGVSSAGRYKDWPDVPTMAEAGFPSVDLVFWVGLSGPPGLPANIVKILENAVRESLSTPDVIAKLDKMGFTPFYESGDKYWKFILDEREAIKALKLK
jgi:tripartite-type tricarboxylate transporter receptor subunit TctC